MTFLNGLTFTQALTRLVAYLVVATVHAFIFAAIANRLGDKDPAFNGRLTLNPFVQASIPGLVSAILFHTGWSKPIPLAIDKLWGRWRGALIVLFASLAALLLLAAILNPVRLLATSWLGGSTELNVLATIEEVQQQCILFVLLNLLPLPGLTGQVWIEAFAPRAFAMVKRYTPGFMIALLIAGALGIIGLVLTPFANALSALLIVQVS